MSTLLHIDSSPRAAFSVTRTLTAEYVAEWRKKNPDGKVISRDLAEDHPTAINLAWVGAIFTPESDLSGEQRRVLELSEALITELKNADQYVFGVPMINFSVPAAFKLYIDQVVRAGKTFSYTSEGPKGLLQGKKALVFVAAGGSYEKDSPAAAMNFVEPYLRTIFGFVGITDLTFVAAENMSKVMSGKVDLEQHLAPVRERLKELVVAG
jgi:FMN-dependent NADH-azoreductase